MSPQEESSPIHHQAADTMTIQSEHLECTVKNLTAKVFLNRPAEDLLPVRYLRKAKQTTAVQRKAWIFRSGNKDGRDVDLYDWSKVDIRYRGVFRTLSKCPGFMRGLWDGGSELCQSALDNSKPKAQGQVIYALLDEIGEELDLRRETNDGRGVFVLAPRLIETQIEYWTGYREKHRDGPQSAGFLSLEFRHEQVTPQLILPVSTTVEEETLVSALQGKFKLMLGQLLHHVRPLSLPGDKLPDQEIFLIGLHGSKLHLMRAFFPGQKISSLWCRRELTSSNPSSPIIMMQGPSHQSPETSCSTHIEDYDPENGTGDSQEDSSEDGQGSQSRSNSNRFYAAENIERLRQRLQATQLQRLDHESDLRTFRVLATREYDLWLKDDFTAAVHILVALHTYLLSGKAQCGALQETFIKHPYVGDGYESDSPAESGEELDSRLRDDERKEQMEIEEKEEELRREELIRREEDAAASRVRESMRNSHRDSISSLRDARRRWWDFVWGDSEESLLQKGRGDGNGDGDGDEEGEMIVGNLDT